jgi:hypothetical protein
MCPENWEKGNNSSTTEANQNIIVLNCNVNNT